MKLLVFSGILWAIFFVCIEGMRAILAPNGFEIMSTLAAMILLMCGIFSGILALGAIFCWYDEFMQRWKK